MKLMEKTGDGSLSFPVFPGKDREPSPVFSRMSERKFHAYRRYQYRIY